MAIVSFAPIAQPGWVILECTVGSQGEGTPSKFKEHPVAGWVTRRVADGIEYVEPAIYTDRLMTMSDLLDRAVAADYELVGPGQKAPDMAAMATRASRRR